MVTAAVIYAPPKLKPNMAQTTTGVNRTHVNAILENPIAFQKSSTPVDLTKLQSMFAFVPSNHQPPQKPSKIPGRYRHARSLSDSKSNRPATGLTNTTTSVCRNDRASSEDTSIGRSSPFSTVSTTPPTSAAASDSEIAPHVSKQPTHTPQPEGKQSVEVPQSSPASSPRKRKYSPEDTSPSPQRIKLQGGKKDINEGAKNSTEKRVQTYAPEDTGIRATNQPTGSIAPVRSNGTAQPSTPPIRSIDKPTTPKSSPTADRQFSPNKRKRADDEDLSPAHRTRCDDNVHALQANGASSSAKPTPITNNPSKGSRKVRPDSWVKGFRNPAMTCYRNSVLQHLGTSEAFRKELKKHSDEGKCRPRTRCMACMLHDLYSSHFYTPNRMGRPQKGVVIINNRLVAIYKLTRELLPREFHNPFQQSDAAEYLRSLLDEVEKCMAVGWSDEEKKTKLNGVQRVFGGLYITTLTCPKCSHESITQTKSLDLFLESQLALKRGQEYRLATLYRRYTEETEVEYTCENCKKRSDDCTKVQSVSEEPKFLTVHIQRHKEYRIIRGEVVATKMMKHLEHTQYFRLKKDSTWCYRLQSVVGHSGHDMNGGHYIAWVRQPSDEWARCNDEIVVQTDWDHVKTHRTSGEQFQATMLGFERIPISDLDEVKANRQKANISPSKPSRL